MGNIPRKKERKNVEQFDQNETTVVRETKFDSSEELNELFSALSKAQAELKPAKKDKDNPFFKSKYADLDSCWEALRQPLSKNSIAVIQLPMAGDPKIMRLKTIMTHSSGQWISCDIELIPIKNDPQGYGSALTYGRRYSLGAITGLSTDEDDDGNGASNLSDKNKSYQGGATSNAKEKKIVTEGQLKRLRAIANENKWEPSSVSLAIQTMFKVDSSKKLNMKQYDELCESIESFSPEEFVKAFVESNKN